MGLARHQAGARRSPTKASTPRRGAAAREEVLAPAPGYGAEDLQAEQARAERYGHRLEQVVVHAAPLDREGAAGQETPRPAASGGGRPLPEGLRTQLEQSFGHDFSRVRLHFGSEASRLGAVAFTQGTDIHLARGLPAPESAMGRRVLGHELTHVIQQQAGRVSRAPEEGAALHVESALEREADQAGARVAHGGSVSVSGAGRTAVAGAARASAPRQPLQAVVDVVGTNLTLRKYPRKSGDVYKDKAGNEYVPKPGAAKVGGRTVVIPYVKPVTAKKKAKDLLQDPYDSGGESSSESEIDENSLEDVASEDEADWTIEPKKTGHSSFWDSAIDEEGSLFGVDAAPPDTHHHALASELQKGLSSGKSDTISLDDISTTRYVRAHVKASTDLTTDKWGGTNKEPWQYFQLGESELSQQRRPTLNQPMNLSLKSFGHYGEPKPGATGIYPSLTVLNEIQTGMGVDKPTMAKRLRNAARKGKGFKKSELGASTDKSAEKLTKLRRMNALHHLVAHEEILRSVHHSDKKKRYPSGTALAMGYYLLEKDPGFSLKDMFGRNARYGPMTPGGVASKPERFHHRFRNLAVRLGKRALYRNKSLRDKVLATKKLKRFGKSFILVPTRARLQKMLKDTLGE